MMLRLLRLSPLLALAVLASCASIAGPSSGCLTASCAVISPQPGEAGAAPGVNASAHGWTTTASVNTASHTIDVRLRVPGPLSVDGGCESSVAAWAVGSNLSRYEASPPPGPRCTASAVQVIADGDSAEFSTSIPLPPPGSYTIHGLLHTHLMIGAGMRVSENLPVVTVVVPAG